MQNYEFSRNMLRCGRDFFAGRFRAPFAAARRGVPGVFRGAGIAIPCGNAAESAKNRIFVGS
jgi:hypothetical protein